MATNLSGGILPERFATLGLSLSRLFPIKTLQSRSERTVGRMVAVQLPARKVFAPFIVIATFVVLNLSLYDISSSV